MILEVPFIMENVEKQKLIYDMLNAHPEIDGIFAGDDSLAVIALHVARQMCIRDSYYMSNVFICQSLPHLFLYKILGQFLVVLHKTHFILYVLTYF